MICNTVSMSKRGIQKMHDKTTFLDVGFTKETKLVSSIICGKFLEPLPLKKGQTARHVNTDERTEIY